jgi:hypothetical protein
MNTYPPNQSNQPNNQLPIYKDPSTKPKAGPAIIQTLAVVGMAFLILLAILYVYPLSEESKSYQFTALSVNVTVNENNTLTIIFNNTGNYSLELRHGPNGIGQNYNITNTSLTVYVDFTSIMTEKNYDLAIKITFLDNEIWEEKTVEL